MRFATRNGAPVTLPYLAYESPFGGGANFPALTSKLSDEQAQTTD